MSLETASDEVLKLVEQLRECGKHVGKLQTEMDAALSRIRAGDDAIRELRAERNALVERLRHTPDLRQTVSELRLIAGNLVDSGDTSTAGLLAQARLADLLRRLDEST